MDLMPLPGQPIRDEGTTKKQAVLIMTRSSLELLASSALQVEHRNSNAELGPKMVRVPLLSVALNGSDAIQRVSLHYLPATGITRCSCYCHRLNPPVWDSNPTAKTPKQFRPAPRPLPEIPISRGRSSCTPDPPSVCPRVRVPI